MTSANPVAELSDEEVERRALWAESVGELSEALYVFTRRARTALELGADILVVTDTADDLAYRARSFTEQLDIVIAGARRAAELVA